MRRFFYAFWFVLLVACTPPANNRALPSATSVGSTQIAEGVTLTVRPTDVEVTIVAPLGTVDLAPLTLGPSGAATQEEMPMAATPTPTEPASSTAAAVPVTVDLQQLTPETTVLSSPIVQPAPGGPGGDAAFEQIVEQLRQDLRRFLNDASAEIAFVEVQHRVWQSDALGCPQESGSGDAIDGAIVVLSHRQSEYRYHIAPGRYRLCIDNSSASEGPLQ